MGLNCGDDKALEKLIQQHSHLFVSAQLIVAHRHILASLKDSYSAQLMPLELPIRPFLSSLGAMSEKGQNIILLADGDPLFFGLASSLAEMNANWSYSVIPAISSLQEACARLALPWADIAVLSLHGRKDLSPLYRILASRQNFCLLSGTESDPAYLARFLLDHGCDNYTVNVFQDMGSKREKLDKLTLAECSHKRFSPNCLCLFIWEKKEKIRPELSGHGQLLGSYCTPGLRRGLILELLDIADSDLVWDIGAGSGLLSYEMAQRAWRGEVWAIEESSARALDVQHNRKLLACPNMKLVLGHAPEILEKLPPPSRIFIGGGLSSPAASRLLDVCSSRLLPSGRIVLSCILMENLQKCLTHSWNADCACEVFQVQLAKSAPLGKGFRLVAQNPAFLIKIEKGKCI